MRLNKLPAIAIDMKKKGKKPKDIEEKNVLQILRYGQKQSHLQNLSSMFILQRMQMDGQNGIRIKVGDGKKHNL